MTQPRFSVIALLAVLAFTLPSCMDKATSPPAAPELDSPSLLGATTGSANYIHWFAKAGVYPYHCTYHTNSHTREPGTVIVEDGGLDSAFVSIYQGAYHPASVTVRPNAQVRWQNFDDGVHHTVTSD